MQHTISTQKIHLTRHGSYTSSISITGITSKFIAWYNMQEKNRFIWLTASLVGGIATILPLTLMAIVFGAGNNFNLWLIACIVNVPVLVVNLAVQPTKLIIPVVFFAWAVDAIIMMYCLAIFLIR